MKKLSLLLCSAILILTIGCAVETGRQQPLIGIASAYKPALEEESVASAALRYTYINAVVENGGVPVLLPPNQSKEALQRYVKTLDGLMLTGGDDIPPSAYGEKTHPTTNLMSEQRYKFESRLVRLWLESEKPILGICLGMQMVNVVSGGTLIQDIPSQVAADVGHKGTDENLIVDHLVKIEPDSRLARLLNADEIMVNSVHHQSANDVGRNLKVAARSADGVIEALELTNGQFGLFLQWHPERMDASHKKAVFDSFINACKK
jgi:putative glutamine amidotransferase